MTQSGVGRNQRTASRLAHVPASGSPILRTGHSQPGGASPTGRSASRAAVPAVLTVPAVPADPAVPAVPAVAERSGRHAGRTALRIGLRALAVGGFATAAWLLSASAAQAADGGASAGAAQGSLPVLSLVDDLGAGLVGDGSSTTGREPSHTGGPGSSAQHDGRPSTQHGGAAGSAPLRGAAGSAPFGGAAAPAAGATSIVLPSSTMKHSVPIVDAMPADQPAGGSGRVTSGSATGTGGSSSAVDPLSTLFAPLGGGQALLGGGQAAGGGLFGVIGGMVTPTGLAGMTGLSPLTRAIDPVVSPLGQDLLPVIGLLPVAAAPVTAGQGRVTRGPVDGPAHEPTGVLADHCGSDRPAATAASAGTQPAAADQRTTLARRFAGAHLRASGAPDARPGTGQVPGRPDQGPLRGHLGTGFGAPTTGSGSSESGAFAALPSSVAAGAEAVHRLPAATDVAVLRHQAEAPTVSPD